MGGWRAAEGGRGGGREGAEGAGGRVGEFTFKGGEEKMELEEGDGRDEFANRGRGKKKRRLHSGGHGGIQTSANTQLTS